MGKGLAVMSNEHAAELAWVLYLLLTSRKFESLELAVIAENK